MAVVAVFVSQVIDHLPMLVGQGQALGFGDDGHDLVTEVRFQQKVFFTSFQFFAVQNVSHGFLLFHGLQKCWLLA